jgi:hypothetical protein
MGAITPRAFKVIASVAALGILSATAWGADRIRFNEQIRPLLSDRCFACHGPDAKRREADLRLDVRADAVGEGEGPAGIVPGRPGQSPLWQRITSTDADLQMPPPSSKKPKFSDDELKLIQEWIAQGAEYEGHWAFLPLGHVAGPTVVLPTRNSIDAFVRSKLERLGVQPSPPTDRATLLRRVTLDLTGLAPSPEDVTSFLEDDREDAYERVVDQLLGSPHYGERWGRHWLDQARYADSNGYAIDAPRDMWPYRDWVIDAVNRDLPFDQFTVEQLAGDLLPSPTKSQLIATGFHRNTLINQEGGSDREQFRVEAALDRVNTTGAVWLGLTVGCAQCHTHKFDPITHREYYELFAFFNSAQDANDRGPTIEVRRGEVFGNPEVLPAESRPLSKDELAKLRTEWEDAKRSKLAGSPAVEVWSPLKYQVLETESKLGRLERGNENSVVYDRKGSANERFVITGATELSRVVAVRLRVLMHETLPKHGPGTAGNGNFVLSEFRLRMGDESLTIARAFADHEQPSYPISAAIDGDTSTGWAINVGPQSTAKMNANHEAVFVLTQPVDLTDRHLTVEMAHDVNRNYTIGRFAIDVTATVPDERQVEDPVLIEALQTPLAQRSQQQLETVRTAFEKAEPLANPAKKEPNPKIAQYMIMRDQPQPRETFIFTRGDFTRPDKSIGKLSPGLLSAVSPARKDVRNRLDLARWLVHPENPLTSRVAVNRIWMRYFGRGLVETEEDFGTQGTPPTHPELLDWLSRDFQRGHWSVKGTHRSIVTSETYRQSSSDRPDLSERDPRNLLLARQQRLRLEAEITRDVALVASGELDPTVGGPSVFPPQPDGMYAFTQVQKQWPTESGSPRFRRTLYTFYYRSAPYPLFTTFDAPDFQATCTRRLRSNTPLQALTLANDAVFIELARALAVRLVADVPGPFAATLDERIDRAALLCFARKPTTGEAKALRDFVIAQVAEFDDDRSAADKLTSPALRARLPASEGAALVLLARALFNADNFITRE